MAGRIKLSKKLRFNVFKRDEFVCQYCGRKPPAVVLEVDHVQSVKDGGSNDDYNLITSCFDCNRGKGVGTLEAAPIDLAARAALLEERLEQTKAYEKLLRKQRHAVNENIEGVVAIYELAFEGWTLKDNARRSIRQFLLKLPAIEIGEAMEMACDRVERDSAFKYFCGVCWKKIKGNGS